MLLRRALSIAVVAALCACRPEPALRRPRGVPQDAVWAGGVDGGAWIRCQRRSSTEYFCAVFDDQAGEPWARGLYALQGAAAPRAGEELPYGGFDGDTIHLVGGGTLRPLRR